MAQHNFLPGIPVDYQLNLPVASTMTVNIPARAPVQDNHTDRVIATYGRDGRQ